jgi:hypothetical protein
MSFYDPTSSLYFHVVDEAMHKHAPAQNVAMLRACIVRPEICNRSYYAEKERSKPPLCDRMVLEWAGCIQVRISRLFFPPLLVIHVLFS